ncbi:MAG: ATP-binding protein [Ktedonobacteraceae bacterium]
MELVIFIGLQASGKSTFYRTHFADTHEYVSKDMLPNNKKNEQQMARIIDALQAQCSIVVDNTNPALDDRAALIALGRTYDAEIIGYYFDAAAKQCVERNKQREGKARVPDKVIYITASRLTQPTYAEGFDRLYVVEIAGNDEFRVCDATNG